VVLSLLSLLVGDLGLLDGGTSALALEHLRSDKTLDLGALDGGLAVLLHLLTVDLDVVADIIILGQVEHLPDLGSTLGTALARLLLISEARELVLTLLHDDKVEHGEIGGDNATADRLAAALTITAAITAEARVTRGHEDAHTARGEDTLLHGETLLVLATHDLEDVALELFAKSLTLNFLREALVEESTELAVIINLQLLLASRGGICDIELHGSY